MSVRSPDDTDTTLLTISEKGYGKRTEFGEYRLQGRGGSGIVNLKISDKTGSVAAILDVHEDDDLMVVTDGGMIIRTRVNSIRVMGRSTQGVRVINLKDGQTVAGVGKLPQDDEEEGIEGEERTDVFTVRLWQEVPADEVAEEDVVTGTTGE